MGLFSRGDLPHPIPFHFPISACGPSRPPASRTQTSANGWSADAANALRRSLLLTETGPLALMHHELHCAVHPPSMGSAAPVIEAPASVHRNTASAPICSVVTNWRVG